MQTVTALNSFNFRNHSSNSNGSPSALGFHEILNAVTQTPEGPKKTNTFVSAEQSLKEVYPDLKYHVLDASQFTYWNRLDFPTSAFFKDTVDEGTVSELRAWRPRSQTATGYESWVENIQPGIHAVMIHPTVQGGCSAAARAVFLIFSE